MRPQFKASLEKTGRLGDWTSDPCFTRQESYPLHHSRSNNSLLDNFRSFPKAVLIPVGPVLGPTVNAHTKKYMKIRLYFTENRCPAPYLQPIPPYTYIQSDIERKHQAHQTLNKHVPLKNPSKYGKDQFTGSGDTAQTEKCLADANSQCWWSIQFSLSYFLMMKCFSDNMLLFLFAYTHTILTPKYSHPGLSAACYQSLGLLRGMDKFDRFFTNFTKGGIFCDFLIAFLCTKGSTVTGKNIFPFKVDPCLQQKPFW